MQRKAITFAILTAMVGVGTVLSGCGDKKKLHRQLRVIHKASLVPLKKIENFDV